MRQAHTPSGRLRKSVEDIVSANGDIGLTRVEQRMVGISMDWDREKTEEEISVLPL